MESLIVMVFVIDINLDDHGLAERMQRKAGEVENKTRLLLLDATAEVEDAMGDAAPHRTGRLKSRAIKHKIIGDHGVVYPDRGVAPYCNWVIEGRGPVQARNKKYLHFFIDGQEFFMKRVKASKPNDFVKKAYNTSQAPVTRLVRDYERWVTTL